MRYFAYGDGFVTLKKDVVLPDEIKKNIKDYFEYVNFGDSIVEVSSGNEEYNEFSLYDLLNSLIPFIDGGKLEYTGEDDCHWKIAFDSSEWHEYSGRVVYEDEKPSFIIPAEDRDELLGQFADVAEDLLDNKGVILPNEERKENDEEDQANLYGSDYDWFTERCADILNAWGIKFAEVSKN